MDRTQQPLAAVPSLMVWHEVELLAEAWYLLDGWSRQWSSWPEWFAITDPLFEDRGRIGLRLHPRGIFAEHALQVARLAARRTGNVNIVDAHAMHISVDWTVRALTS